MKRIWYLNIYYFDKPEATIIKDIMATDKEVKQAMLDHIKKVVKRRKLYGSFSGMLIPRTPREGETFSRAEDIIQLKNRYSNRRLLRIKNPDKVLVQGYGPEALKALER